MVVPKFYRRFTGQGGDVKFRTGHSAKMEGRCELSSRRGIDAIFCEPSGGRPSMTLDSNLVRLKCVAKHYQSDENWKVMNYKWGIFSKKAICWSRKCRHFFRMGPCLFTPDLSDTGRLLITFQYGVFCTSMSLAYMSNHSWETDNWSLFHQSSFAV